ncbi:MAG: hypothetical protein WAM58_20775 [Candidatus Acidiferrum sp.]
MQPTPVNYYLDLMGLETGPQAIVWPPGKVLDEILDHSEGDECLMY